MPSDAKASDYARFLKGSHLEGKPAIVTITAFTHEETHPRPNEVEKALVMHIAEPLPPLVLSPTNRDTLTDLFGNRIAAWVGNRVELRPIKVKVGRVEKTPIRIYPAPKPEKVDLATGEITTTAPAPEPAASPATPPPPAAPPPTAPPPPERPWTAELTRSKILTHAFELHLDAIATNGDLTGAMAALSNVTNGDDGKRKAILRYVLGIESAKSLTVGQCKSIKRWIAAKPNDAGEWIPSAHAIAEAERILEADAVARGQQRLPLTGDPVLDAFAGK